MSKTIFITGASKGFGRVWTESALKNGYNVIATARNISALDSLVVKFGKAILPLQLDVTDRNAGIDAIKRGHKHFGRLDVLINNAGYGLFGAIEENTEEEIRNQMETNFFGALWLTQAVIPIMREQGSGHIIQISSIGGVITLPIMGIYHASKFALEAFSESLANEVSQFGVKVSIVEPGGYETDWLGASSINSKPIDQYNGIKDFLNSMMEGQKFNPENTGPALLKLIEEEKPPLRVLFGKVWPMVKGIYEERMKTWEDWQELSVSAS
ncbi:short-chain dehydrogenase/reductase [Dyadobacter frigoris]|uniref:SDR family NAD(P)-dependent oxidoreductase n=1 Tax=Dyadobacter frigoris TaxID=2576211 RepID=UPI0024A1FABE|nr:SDR family NAD(P)-dependent oxidoreductase [Dyadobacter frigoris]GLU55213.1 short-chain dehydrogenase/reductase [Dyadobacter frigoris]